MNQRTENRTGRRILGLLLALWTGGMAFVGAPGAVRGARAIVGMPLTPMSYAGVARRSVRRTAYVGAAAAASTVPAGYVSTLPAGCVNTVVGGAATYSCGGAYYRPTYYGTSMVYAPVPAP